MSVTSEEIRAALSRVAIPDGKDLISGDLVRAVQVDGSRVRFVIEAPSPEIARLMEPVRKAAEAVVRDLPGVSDVSVALTAHGPAKEPPKGLKIGGHPKPQAGSLKPAGVRHILAIGSGKGGVGKSTVSSNLAVSLARAGRRVGLLDADIYGPSQPRMMGVSQKPESPDGQTIIPLKAHGVTVMSIGLMLPAEKAVVWRGPMLMGALQQMLSQVAWGDLDVLLVDLPPGTGDIGMTLCQKANVSGALVVSTPQDVALLDARKALDMFETLKTPVLGLIENMAVFTCPHCGGQSHIFGAGGMVAEASARDIPLLAQLPLDLDTRLAGDGGAPVAAGEGPMAEAYAQLAERLIKDGVA